jgi:hypothetical protein
MASLGDYFASLAALVRPGGLVCFEVDHLLSTIEGGQFDAFRHGHYAYFSLHALRSALALHGLNVLDAVAFPAYGGSLRVYAASGPSTAYEASASTVLAAEEEAGLRKIETYRHFAASVNARAAELRSFLEAARAEGRSIIGYGAPSRAATLLTTAGVGRDLLPLLVDRSPAKQGRRLAGTDIPIGAVDAVGREKPDYLLILTWNLAEEVVDQMREIRAWGGRFVVPLPRLQVLD